MQLYDFVSCLRCEARDDIGPRDRHGHVASWEWHGNESIPRKDWGLGKRKCDSARARPFSEWQFWDERVWYFNIQGRIGSASAQLDQSTGLLTTTHLSLVPSPFHARATHLRNKSRSFNMYRHPNSIIGAWL
jgi:hypothetical protein